MKLFKLKDVKKNVLHDARKHIKILSGETFRTIKNSINSWGLLGFFYLEEAMGEKLPLTK